MNQLHGDGIVVDGELHFVALGEQRFKDSVPIGTSFPARVEETLMERVYKEVSRVIRDSGYLYGGVNIEVRITAENKNMCSGNRSAYGWKLHSAAYGAGNRGRRDDGCIADCNGGELFYKDAETFTVLFSIYHRE